MGSLNTDLLDALVEAALRAGRIPGGALAIVAGGRTVFAKGYGYRDLEARLPFTSHTIYPIASTTKAMTATLLGMLVDEGRLSWNAPVQEYLPGFRLQDPVASAQTTLRDLLAMRTGLPRHDWLWHEHALTRADLVHRLRYLEPSAGFREKFQYNNMSVTTAGYIAEVVTNASWEDLVHARVLAPLGMTNTVMAEPPTEGNVTLGYHETSARRICRSTRLAGTVTAPAGGLIHSTVESMARWILFNLCRGHVGERQLISPQTFADIRSPQVPGGADPSSPSAHACYAMGWFVDTYNGRTRISHGGYLHDINSEVSLFSEDDIGIVSVTNFGFPGLARVINQQVFDALRGCPTVLSVEEKLSQYEKRIEGMRERAASAQRVPGTAPSHPLDDYTGVYEDRGYGPITIARAGEDLIFRRGRLELALEHWHYDSWVARDAGIFFLHTPHAFDRLSRLLFETDANGAIAAVSIALEPAVGPVRFRKLRRT